MKEYRLELIKIGETYIKFDFDFNETNQELIKKAYLEQIGFSSFEFFKNRESLKISIEYDEGSLKTRIIVWGTAIYMGLANYGSFRAGVRELVNDVKDFSEYVIEHIDDDPNISNKNIIRTEKRTGLPGRIQDIYNRIDKLEKNINNLTNNQIQQEIQLIKQEVANLYTVLPFQERDVFLNELSNNFKQNLPNPNDSRTDYLANRYGLKPDEDVEFINN
ncbi:hypothetical protein [Arenibacter sp. ARW7G5Y1]|uniref:hypothetical protein n=1 Tax=Arenibacter sp. ARW7G5Y1 TaxID=2135619 RepID=UPI000D76B9EE|nr:hypothetical protein [Arenibacter sp. ARW7G5Y1]PXX22848.1 hypothetical protein C7972_12227 [Arenibacter sp. ARW7G5Y1]